MPVSIKGTGGGSVTLDAGAAASATTLTLPNTTGTVALTASPTFSGTLTATTITSPAATALTIQSAGTTAMTINTSQNIGIGTTSPDYPLTIQGGDAVISIKDTGGTTRAYVGVGGVLGAAPTGALRVRSEQGGIYFGYQGAVQAAIDTSNNFQFNSGFGSSATAYGCRAWANFSGSTPTIRASGGVTSITKNGTGSYTLNFSFTMPDANYSVVAVCNDNPGVNPGFSSVQGAGTTTASPNIVTAYNSSGGSWTNFDATYVRCAVFR